MLIIKPTKQPRYFHVWHLDTVTGEESRLSRHHIQRRPGDMSDYCSCRDSANISYNLALNNEVSNNVNVFGRLVKDDYGNIAPIQEYIGVAFYARFLQRWGQQFPGQQLPD